MTTETGRAAYEAWASQMYDLAAWDDLPDETRAAWEVAAQAAIDTWCASFTGTSPDEPDESDETTETDVRSGGQA